MLYDVTEINLELDHVCHGQDGGGHHFQFFVAVSHASKAHVICVTGPSCFQVCNYKNNIHRLLFHMIANQLIYYLKHSSHFLT